MRFGQDYARESARFPLGERVRRNYSCVFFRLRCTRAWHTAGMQQRTAIATKHVQRLCVYIRLCSLFVFGFACIFGRCV